MKPPPFEYARPGTVDEAVALLARPGAMVLAGGQSLVPALNQRDLHPALLVDINRVDSLDAIELTGDGALRLGATVRQQTAAKHPLVRAHALALAEAAAHVGWQAVRNRGTVLGSLAQGAAYAEIPGAALLLGARVLARSEAGERWIPAAALHGPEGRRPDELLVALEVPASPAGSAQAFVEQCRRSSGVPVVSVSARVRLDAEGRLTEARAAITGAAPRAVLAEGLEALLGAAPDAEALAAAGRRAAAGGNIDPYEDVHGSAAYRRRLVSVLLPKALSAALAQGGAA
ncbi:MAG: FAD binding domain-containing protein [Alphaproteobacteria bacterium]|nr:FAD binding domain-containing protein [Alphaproteobacteria bacterium]